MEELPNLSLCQDESPSFYIFDFSTPPALLYYSYFPSIFLVLLFGILVFVKDRHSLRSKLLLGVGATFTLWVFNVIVQWISSYHTSLMFAWQLTSLFEVLFFVTTIYFIFVFLNKGEDVSNRIKYIFAAIILPVAILLPTKMNISFYDPANCEGVIGPIWYGIYAFEILSLLWIAIVAIRKYRNATKQKEVRSPIILASLGVIFLLGLFSASNIFAEIFKTYEINLVGPVGVAAFVGLLSYMTLKYKTFNLKLLGTQILVFVISFLVASLLFIQDIYIIHALIAITLIFLVIFGYLLIKSVMREVKQRVELQKLTGDLASANEKLKGLDKLKTEFLSLASHQLRSPLTAIKGYTSMVLDGTYGPISEEQKEPITRVYQSTEHLVKIVEDLLNVSKIEQGGMVFNMTDDTKFDALVKDVFGLVEVTAKQRNLGFVLDVSEGDYSISMDQEKMRQVILNLFDNSIKYTKEGGVDIKVFKPTQNTIRLEVKDSGMGVTPEIKERLFQKFSRGDGARMNTTGSGLGLYLAKQIIAAHKGNIWVESEGKEKGSTFIIELFQEK